MKDAETTRYDIELPELLYMSKRKQTIIDGILISDGKSLFVSKGDRVLLILADGSIWFESRVSPIDEKVKLHEGFFINVRPVSNYLYGMNYDLSSGGVGGYYTESNIRILETEFNFLKDRLDEKNEQ